jgi:hypothetical protein
VKILYSFAILCITVIALYCATAGWINAELHAALKENKATAVSQPVIYHGIQFVNEDALKRYEQAAAAKEWFPWMVNLPQPLALFLTTISFGVVGGVIRVVFDSLHTKVGLDGSSFGRIFLAGLTGILVLGISYVIPAALTFSEVTLRPVALLFLCLIGGIFYDHLIAWVKTQLGKIFQ